MLPPIFRYLSQLVTLPHRRFYTPATDYKNVPQHDQDADPLRRAIPSVIDLPGMVELEVDTVGESTARRKHGSNHDLGGRVVKQRNGNGKGAAVNGARGAKVVNREARSVKEKEALGLGIEEMGGKAEVETVKHYDADGESLFSIDSFLHSPPPFYLIFCGVCASRRLCFKSLHT